MNDLFKHLTFFVLFFSLMTSSAQANVCDRSSGVVAAIEVMTKKQCEAVTKLDLAKLTFISFGTIYGLKRHDFDGMTNLTTLVISFDKGGLPGDILSDLPKLIHLYIDSKSTKKIPKDLFKANPNLKAIALNLPRVKNIPDKVFADLENLTALDKHATNINWQVNSSLFSSIVEVADPRLITQVEEFMPTAVQKLMKTPFKDYWSYAYFEYLPKSDDVAQINRVRQQAIDVCTNYPKFCPTRQEIHEFPVLAHLKETEKLYDETHSETVKALRDSLREFFSMKFDYSRYQNALDLTGLGEEIAGYIRIKNPTLAQIALFSQKIHSYLTQNFTKDSNERQIFALFALQSYMQFQFKTLFRNEDLKNVTLVQQKEVVTALLNMSTSKFLFSNREANSLRDQIDTITTQHDLSEALKLGIKFQIDRLQNLYLETDEAGTDNANSIYQEVIRTSMVTEWDTLLRSIQN